jgi:hypothetical protein
LQPGASRAVPPQQGGRFPLILLLDERQGGFAVSVGGGNVRALCDQRAHCVEVVVRGGNVQRLPAGSVDRVDVGAGAEQEAGNEAVVAGERRVERRVAVRILRSRTDVGAPRQEQFGQLGMAEERGEVQGRPAVATERVDRAGRVVEQPIDAIVFAGGTPRRSSDRRRATPAGSQFPSADGRQRLGSRCRRCGPGR